MRINRRLIRKKYGHVVICRAYRKLGEAIQTGFIDPINEAFIKALEDGRLQLFENEDGTITSPLIYVDLKDGNMTWENVKP